MSIKYSTLRFSQNYNLGKETHQLTTRLNSKNHDWQLKGNLISNAKPSLT